VLVEVDAVTDLCAAYPNYFMDVSMFTDRLARYTNIDVTEPPAPSAPRHSRFGDLSFVRDWRRMRGSSR
jgi:hypothetical protein